MENKPIRLHVIRVVIFAIIYTIIQTIYIFAGTGIVTTIFVASSFLVGVLFALVLGYIFSRAAYRLKTRIVMSLLTLFVIQMLSNTIEALFFTTQISTTFLFIAALLFQLVIALFESIAVVILFPPQKSSCSLKKDMKDYFGQRPWHSWLWRIIFCSLAYLPIYYTFGSLISPIIYPYYSGTSIDLGLTIPSLEILIPLEIFRGLLYVAVLLPILAVLKINRKSLYFIVVSLLYITGAVGPFLVSETLPLMLRVTHGLEILADFVIFGAVVVYLLGRKGNLK